MTKMMHEFRKEITRPVGGQPVMGLPDPVCVEITPAAHHYYEGTSKEIWDMREDFHCITPPWPYCWLEFQNPKFANMGGRMEKLPWRSDLRTGLLSITLEVKKDQYVAPDCDPLRMLFRIKEERMKKIGHIIKQSQLEEEREELLRKWKGIPIGWIWHTVGFASGRERIIPYWEWGIYLDRDGRALPELGLGFAPSDFAVMDLSTHIESNNPHGMLGVFCFALALMHCENVAIIDEPINQTLLKKRDRTGKPRLRFKVLDVRPTIARHLNRDNRVEPARRNLPLHICRGHFKDYREGPGLFGRQHGIWWWPMYTRGDLEFGKIDKEYRILPPSL